MRYICFYSAAAHSFSSCCCVLSGVPCCREHAQQVLMAMLHRMQWYRGIRGEVTPDGEYDSKAQIFYILLEFATLVWFSQVSQAPKHIDPSNDTIMDSLMKSRTRFSNMTASNPVPEPQREIVQSHEQMVLDKLGWHARMVWSQSAGQQRA